MNDEKIIAAISRREEDAMAVCMNQYVRLLWKVACSALKNVGNEQDMEECVADAFIYLWEHPDKFDPKRGDLKTLLCIVTRSRAIDRYRQIVRQKTFPVEQLVLAEHFGLQETLLQMEEKEKLRASVEELGQPARDILVRRYYYDQKPREIALAMGLSVKQVNNALYQAKQHLKAVITAR